ncbi:MAG TPA: alpha-1,4-glucan--maltose-1-phosphate maltosyltransferase, partial [Terriglobales bacterium]
RLEGIRFLRADNPQMLLYARYSPGFADLLVVAVNLDPHNAQEGPIEIPADELGLNPTAGFEVNDLLGTPRGLWRGRQHYWKLEPAQPAAILHLS